MNMVSDPSTLHAVVDMGSNGIRFSITNTSSPQLPTLYHSRAGISLYDAQFSSSNYTRHPVPDNIIQDVLTRLVHFQTVCEDFDVPPESVHVLATEATRTAPNSEAFRTEIRKRTGWEVRMLKKEEEGRIGAMGVVASCGRPVGGLVMDLGGGSTQITWIMDEKDGGLRTSPRGSFSFPYGAAALKNRLEQVGRDEKGREELRGEMVRNFQQAYRDLEVPKSLLQMAKERGGLDLYLCGGGFRGWGYLLMEQASVNPYPIPIINGFRVRKEEFHDTASVLGAVDTDVKIFGVSKRRASQVPAVAFLANVLVDALPDIQNIQFCQGGVREGFLFDRLPVEIRVEDPLLAATRPYATASADAFQRLLSSALPSTPPTDELAQVPPSFSPHLLFALANLLFAHTTIPKESRCATALHSTTTGLLASTNNLTHTDRAILALTLCERWDGELAPTDQSLYTRLSRCVSAREVWWCRYLGRVAALIGDVHPTGKVSGHETRWRIQFNSQWDELAKEKKGERQTVLRLRVRWNEDVMRDSSYSLNEHTGRIEKVGKRKNWVEGSGVKIQVEV